MDSSFSNVFAFLRNFEGGEVEGHSSNPPGDVEAMLNKLLSGKLSTEEKKETCDLLRHEPEWVGWMADKIKARRSGASSR